MSSAWFYMNHAISIQWWTGQTFAMTKSWLQHHKHVWSIIVIIIIVSVSDISITDKLMQLIWSAVVIVFVFIFCQGQATQIWTILNQHGFCFRIIMVQGIFSTHWCFYDVFTSAAVVLSICFICYLLCTEMIELEWFTPCKIILNPCLT